MATTTPRINPPTGPQVPKSLEILLFCLQTIGTVKDKCSETFGAVSDTVKKVVWGDFYLLAADVAADILDLQPSLFSWFSRSSAWLRTTALEVKLLTEVASFLVPLSAYITSLLVSRRADLASAVNELNTGIAGIKASKLTPPDVIKQLEELAQPLEDILARRNATAQTKKRASQKTSNTINALTQQVESLGATPAVAAKKSKTRSTKR